MRRALTLAARGTGAVSPNPRVGCVIVDEAGQVIGEGWHGRYGGPHAEVWAIRDATARHGADALRGATLVVTLEPCAHHGKTPPCADLIVETGIPRVVVGTRDPFPAVDGRGIERLRAAGVAVTVGVEQDACRRLNDAFAFHARTGRPYVALKVAQTLDGVAATEAGHSRWVTGPEARARVHAWRAGFDAVLIGAGTARADDPALTVRDAEGRAAAARRARPRGHALARPPPLHRRPRSANARHRRGGRAACLCRGTPRAGRARAGSADAGGAPRSGRCLGPARGARTAGRRAAPVDPRGGRAGPRGRPACRRRPRATPLRVRRAQACRRPPAGVARGARGADGRRARLRPRGVGGVGADVLLSAALTDPDAWWT